MFSFNYIVHYPSLQINIFEFLRNDSLTCINLPLVSRFFENLKESKLMNNQKYNMQSKRQRNGQRMMKFLYTLELTSYYNIELNQTSLLIRQQSHDKLSREFIRKSISLPRGPNSNILLPRVYTCPNKDAKVDTQEGASSEI